MSRWFYELVNLSGGVIRVLCSLRSRPNALYGRLATCARFLKEKVLSHKGVYGKPEKADATTYFVAVGAQKAGTTWLHSVLSAHPDVYVTRCKELHYFNAVYGTDFHKLPKALSAFLRLKAVLVPNALQSRLLELFGGGRRARVAMLAYQKNDAWYRALLNRPQDKPVIARGEITPAYMIVSETALRHMRDLLPGVKIILILRNPIDRVWSSYRYFVKERGLGSLSSKAFREFMERKDVVERTDYEAAYNRLLKVFPREQLLVLFYEQLRDAPETFLSQVYEFLDVPHLEREHAEKFGSRSVNASPSSAIPSEDRQALVEQFGHLAVFAKQTFASVPEEWEDLYGEYQALGE